MNYWDLLVRDLRELILNKAINLHAKDLIQEFKTDWDNKICKTNQQLTQFTYSLYTACNSNNIDYDKSKKLIYKSFEGYWKVCWLYVD